MELTQERTYKMAPYAKILGTKLGWSLINVEIDLFESAGNHCARTPQVLQQVLDAS